MQSDNDKKIIILVGDGTMAMSAIDILMRDSAGRTIDNEISLLRMPEDFAVDIVSFPDKREKKYWESKFNRIKRR